MTLDVKKKTPVKENNQEWKADVIKKLVKEEEETAKPSLLKRITLLVKKLFTL